MVVLSTLFLLAFSATAFSGSPNFTFDIPTIPQCPELSEVSNSTPVAGTEYFTVSANIQGVEQKEACCGPNCDRSDCSMEDWYMRPDPNVFPNPTCIPNANGHPDFADYEEYCKKPGNPKVYYKAYPQAGESISGNVEMTYNSINGKFEANIPLAGLQQNDEISYYIVASDSRGNVISQLPDQTTVPCTSTSSWNTDYETPPLNNCSFMNGYDLCSNNQEGSPVCGSDYSVNDPAYDTCGEPDSQGNASVVTGVDLVDILGISSGAGKGFSDLPGQDVVCSRIGLMDAPPNTSEGVIDAYVMIFFNPDINDPNPADIHMENAFAITYAPEVGGSEPNLVKVLWDGDCVSNPDTKDILGCKVFVGSDSESRLKIKYNNGDLVFIAQNVLEDGRTMIGNSSKETTMIFGTGAIQLSGGTPFWLTDLTSGLTMQKITQSDTVREPGKPAAPGVKQRVCQATGTGDSPTCAKSDPKPASNECVMDITPSSDKLFTSYYNVYHSMTDNAADATLVTELSGASGFPEDGSVNYTKSYSISTLDGKPHYFFLSSVNTGGSEPLETDQGKWTKTSCTVEDWEAPDPPDAFTCSTPEGFDSTCKCQWSADYTADPSLYGFYIKRDGVPLNPTAAILTQNYTDSDESIENGLNYTYEVRAIDIGDNYSDWISTSCVPRDLEAPAQVDTLGVVLQSGVIGVDLSWEPESAEDIENYNVYACEQTVTSTCGADAQENPEGYILLNDTTIISQPDPPETLTYSDNSSFGDKEATWCFYVETCDNCVSAGTCPGQQESNCSAFNTMSIYRKCVFLTPTPETAAPLFPENQAAAPLPEGGKCKLTWDMVRADEEDPFADYIFPKPDELMGYYIMRANAIGGDCSNTPVPPPSSGTPVGLASAGANPSFTDEGLTNGSQYCYRVYGYDSANNFSRNDPIPSPVSCKPDDLLPPDKPEIKVPVGFSQNTCTPEWDAVEDNDTVTYNVYRCEGTEAECNDPGGFVHLGSEQQLDACEDTTDTQCEDWTLEPDTQYMYCITAKDAQPNESDIYDSEDTINCSPCMATSRCPQPTGVIAGEKGPSYYGVDVYWQHSSSDDGSGEGYYIYLCTGSTADTCTTRLDEDNTPVNGDYSSTPYTIADAGVSVEASYYIGVSYEGKTCGESAIAVSENSVKLKPQDNCIDNPDCSISINIANAFTKKELAPCVEGDLDVNCQKVLAACAASTVTGCTEAARKFVTSPAAGITIELFDATTGTAVKAKSTLADGTLPEFALKPSSINFTHEYSIRLRLPEGYWNEILAYSQTDGAGCAPDSGDGECILEIDSTVDIGLNPSIGINAMEIPIDASAFGGQFANPDCDEKVTLKDLAAVKKRFFTNATMYHPAVDFNLDGKIDLKDLAMIKANFNKSIGEKGLDISTMGAVCDPDM